MPLAPSARVLKCLKLIEFGLVRKRGSRNTAKALQNDKRNLLLCLHSQCDDNSLHPATPSPPKDASVEVVAKHTPQQLFIARCAPSKTTHTNPQTCVRRASSPAPPTPRWWATSASALARSRPTSTCASLPTARPASRSVSRLERAARSSLPC
jgi:hypothetical protein